MIRFPCPQALGVLGRIQSRVQYVPLRVPGKSGGYSSKQRARGVGADLKAGCARSGVEDREKHHGDGRPRVLV